MLLDQDYFSKVQGGIVSGKMLFMSSDEIVTFKTNVKTKCFIVIHVQSTLKDYIDSWPFD